MRRPRAGSERPRQPRLRRHEITARAEYLFRTARYAQEHVMRVLTTLIAVASAYGFCTGLGEDSASTSIGQFFAVLFAGIPAAWLWAREFHEVRIRREKAAIEGDTEDWSAAAAGSRTADDEDEDYRIPTDEDDDD